APPAARSCSRPSAWPRTPSARRRRPRSAPARARSRARGTPPPARPRAEPRELLGLCGRAVLEELLAQPERVGDRRAGPPGHDVRADLRQPPLRELGEAVVQVARDGELEDAVAEELEPLVRGRPVRRPGRVRE